MAQPHLNDDAKKIEFTQTEPINKNENISEKIILN
jgi:hypothetical protein